MNVLTASGDVSALEVARLETEAARLIDFGRRSLLPSGGFGWLDDAGEITAGEPLFTWIACRMTHCGALALMRGCRGADVMVDHGVAALRGPLRDGRHGGWHSAVAGREPVAGVKEAYAHVFVVLAAATSYAAGHPDAESLLDEALGVMERHFWREDDGMVVDAWDRSWTSLDPYRGVNANMHAVEAFLAAHDATGDLVWLDRAARIVTRVVDGVARDHDWRLPEHFDERWRALADYNRDEPGHPFRPYGVTIGHLLEWGRLALHLRTALGESAPAWLEPAARAVYDAAVARGWSVDGAEGFVYTTDFEDRPVVRARMHWVVCEAIAAAWTLYRETGDPRYAEHYSQWWEYADAYLLDRRRGSWHHELDRDNRPAATVWRGKPDIYHAYQATILPLLPPAGSFLGALRKGPQ